MIPSYNKIHNRFRLNGNTYDFEDLKQVAYSFVKEGLPFEKDLGDFLIDWLDSKDFILVQTSGSTGQSQQIKLQKQAMVNSAIATGDFFNLKPGDKALHCLSSNFIAGKMMLIRALILGLEIDVIEPSSTPIFSSKKRYDFAAMLPMQYQNVINESQNIRIIILGGAPVSESLKQQILSVSSMVYETYGMTETITHIAAKNLSSKQKHFALLPNVSIATDERDCLKIDAPMLRKESIQTNDIVSILSDTTFDWLGRYDNVINSGGVKLFPEQIESILALQIENRFFVTSEHNKSLGEQLILIVEGDEKVDPKLLSGLDRFQVPKAVYTIPQFIETGSGKIQRQKTKALLNL